MLDARQVRAARALLEWTQEYLAERSGIARATIKNIESSSSLPRLETISTLQRVFEEAGVEFMPSSGVRMKDRMVQIFEGPDAYRQLFDDIFITAQQNDHDVIIAPANPVEAYRLLGTDFVDTQMNKRRHAHIRQRLLIRASDPISQPLETYRILPDDYCSLHPLYVYGPKIALACLQEPQKVIMVNDDRFATGVRKLANFIWDRTEMPAHRK